MKYLIILLITLSIGGWFYWFQWRPSDIKETCTTYSNISALNAEKDRADMALEGSYLQDQYQNAYNHGFYEESDYKTFYIDCLHRKGL